MFGRTYINGCIYILWAILGHKQDEKITDYRSLDPVNRWVAIFEVATREISFHVIWSCDSLFSSSDAFPVQVLMLSSHEVLRIPLLLPTSTEPCTIKKRWKEFIVSVFPLKSGTTYLAHPIKRLNTIKTTPLNHLKRAWKLICSIRHLPPDSSPIHCDPSLNACLYSRACNVDVNLS